jgi:hypothetical protein
MLVYIRICAYNTESKARTHSKYKKYINASVTVEANETSGWFPNGWNEGSRESDPAVRNVETPSRCKTVLHCRQITVIGSV